MNISTPERMYDTHSLCINKCISSVFNICKDKVVLHKFVEEFKIVNRIVEYGIIFR